MAHFRDRRAFGNVGTRRFRGARYGDGKSPRFQGLLDLYGGASAAYSLRALSSGWLAGDVVEVRRSSDNTTDSFTASEVSDGTLVTWVNTNTLSTALNYTIAPYETFTGASSSGFTASNSYATAFAGWTINSGVSGDVVKVSFDLNVTYGSPRISLRDAYDNVSAALSENIEYNTSGSYTETLTASGNFSFVAFTEGDVPSEFTVSNFKILRDGFVSKWYDQSGNGNDATQATTTAQPKIVDAGALVVGGLDFDGVDDYLDISGITTLSNPFTAFTATTLDSRVGFYPIFDGITTNTHRVVVGNEGSTLNDGMYAGSGVNALTQITALALRSYFFRGDASTEYVRNGVSVATGDAGAQVPSSGIRIAADHDLSGGNYSNISMHELIVYDTDESANRVGIETNINNAYSIYS